MTDRPSTSGLAVWLSLAGALVSLVGALYSTFLTLRGPEIEAFEIKNVLVFSDPRPDYAGALGLVVIPEIANGSSDLPEFIVSQKLELIKGGVRMGCFSARGGVRFADVTTGSEMPVDAGSAEDVHRARCVAPAGDVAECIGLRQRTLHVLDVSPRTNVTPRSIYSQRQLFDQLNMSSAADPCHDEYRTEGSTSRYLASALISDVPVGSEVDIVYTAKTSASGEVGATCAIKFTERRLAILNPVSGRAWASIPCSKSSSFASGKPSWWARFESLFVLR